MTRRSRLASALVAASALVLLPALPGHAAGNGRWSVTPTPPAVAGPAPRVYFFLESPPGQTVLDSVRVANVSDKPLTFLIYGADAFNTATDGGFGLAAATDPQHGIGSWTSVSATTVVIPAKSQSDIPFTITVPPNAPPGDHVGGIVAGEAVPSGQTSDGGMTVNVRQAVAARVYLRVSGAAVPGLAVSDLRASGDELSYTLANTGNVHLVPTISVRSSGLFGHGVRQTGAVPQLDLVPGAVTRLRSGLAGAWPVDIVTTKVTVTAEGGVTTSSSTTVLLGVWPALAVLLLAALLAVWLVRRRVRARRLRPRRLV
ncbi:hypothetical protein F4553_006757 [Allocatelliglobosispora scoriae]|uniref:DUF916 domain-containing protein n=1 Tax=Allocatelliglobosispora scoriae TaxID=643052 RepID=A0A841C2F9_9ACTN|nr:DUF916 domain-containing protein [Allocatelliglobosispora scoriae]MBB5873323.1 hypothetical protein [Allocatelliglobosispora scoriae]